MEKLVSFILALEYLFITIIMLFKVQGYFGYIFGTITLIMTGIMFNVWFTWPTQQYKPKQDIVRKPKYRRYGRY
jgi:hypothetical protein